MANEVRSAGYDPKATALFPAITALTPPQVGFTIWNDWNANEVIDTDLSVNVNGTLKGEQITYDVTSAEPHCNVRSPSSTRRRSP